jgi:hypothetical protein
MGDCERPDRQEPTPVPSGFKAAAGRAGWRLHSKYRSATQER